MNMAVRKNAPARKNAPVKQPPARKAAPKAKGKKVVAKSKLAPRPKAKPASKAKPKPAAKVTTKPASAAKVTAKPATKVTAKPATKVTAKPAPKTKGKPALAREARQAAAMKKVIEQVIAPIESDKAVVDAYMRDLDHPFKAEIAAVRDIILGASSKISERIKWNAPSFFYKEDFGAFHPRATEFAHLILLFPDGSGVPAKSSLLEGKTKDRREAKFHSLEDVQSKKRALEKLVKDWVALRDA
jgi:hypothetical protein